MIAEITKIYPAVTLRFCPGCGYEMAQRQIERAKFDHCPNCAKHNLNEFVLIKDNPNVKRTD